MKDFIAGLEYLQKREEFGDPPLSSAEAGFNRGIEAAIEYCKQSILKVEREIVTSAEDTIFTLSSPDEIARRTKNKITQDIAEHLFEMGLIRFVMHQHDGRTTGVLYIV